MHPLRVGEDVAVVDQAAMQCVPYKSGRLVPEYRPAASPTFVLTQHSNSHRKVMELRRPNELVHIRGIVLASAGQGGSGAEHMYRDYGGARYESVATESTPRQYAGNGWVKQREGLARVLH